jgi:hypothetical protein
VGQTALLGFNDRAGMVRHQPNHPIGKPPPPQEPCTVKRMKAGIDQTRRIADVVQPRRRHQDIAVVGHSRAQLRRTCADRLNVRPTTWQLGGQILVRQPSGTVRIDHRAQPMPG